MVDRPTSSQRAYVLRVLCRNQHPATQVDTVPVPRPLVLYRPHASVSRQRTEGHELAAASTPSTQRIVGGSSSWRTPRWFAPAHRRAAESSVRGVVLHQQIGLLTRAFDHFGGHGARG
jgi:hypothetical protein